MFRVVTTPHPEITWHLRGAAFQPLGVQHVEVSSCADAPGAILRTRPQLAILDADLEDGFAHEVCRAIRADARLMDTRVVLFRSTPLHPQELDRVAQARCHDLVYLPMHPDDFYHHVAQIAHLPLRRNNRVSAAIDVLIKGSQRTVHGKVRDVSLAGIGVHLPVPLAAKKKVRLRLRRGKTLFPEAHAAVAWVKEVPADDPSKGYRAGFDLQPSLPIKTRLLLEKLALYDVAPLVPRGSTAQGVSVRLQGDFTEIVQFSTLARRLAGQRLIDFDAAAVRYMSSAGVRSWCQFLKGLDEQTQYSFRHCSVAFSSHAALVPMVVGRGQVISLEAPFVCSTCDREELRLLETELLVSRGTRIAVPALSCSSCPGRLEFDDVPERYFAFLGDDSAALSCG